MKVVDVQNDLRKLQNVRATWPADKPCRLTRTENRRGETIPMQFGAVFSHDITNVHIADIVTGKCSGTHIKYGTLQDLFVDGWTVANG